MAPRRPTNTTPAPTAAPPAPALGTSTYSHAGAAVAELFTAAGRNPFRVSGPAVWSFSGGRTSAYLLRRGLDAYGGRLPDDHHVVFANTGAEDDRTLDFVHECAVRWGVRVRWVEFTLDAPGRWREVDYASANRAYGPFDACIRSRKALPNGRMRFCTEDMKLSTMRGFMRAQGLADDEWTNIVGLRADEIHRVMKLRARPETVWDVAAPLLDAGVTKPDVLRWWASQPFDLRTPEFAGNCCACLAGDTEVVTRDGLRPIRDLAGTTPELLVPKLLPDGTLSEVGAFVAAPVRSFGVQRLWRVDLAAHGGGTKTVYATRDHRWFVAPRRPQDGVPREAVWTENLKSGDKLRNLFRCPIGEHRGFASGIGAMQGFVFGDGTANDATRPGSVQVHASKLSTFGPMFEVCCREHAQDETVNGSPYRLFYGIPRSWKHSYPDLRESRHFLMGWLAGWFAADGCVTETGACILASARREHIEFARSLCAILGIQSGALRWQDRVVTPPYPGAAPREHRIYLLSLNRHHVTGDFFMLPHHKARVEAASGAAVRRYGWKVVAVTPTERVEEVYCATVDGVGAFGLADGLMTGNCFLKGKGLRWRVEHERPGALSWWAEKEAAIGRTFIHKEPEGYAGMQRRVRLGILPGTRGVGGVVCAAPDADDPDDSTDDVPCDCTG